MTTTSIPEEDTPYSIPKEPEIVPFDHRAPRKYCPLRHLEPKCDEAKCEWWMDGLTKPMCAIKRIALGFVYQGY